MDTIKGYLINPRTQTVTEVQVPKQVSQDFKHAGVILGCRVVEDNSAILSRHVVLMDENGIYAPEQHWFSLNGYKLVNNVLVFGGMLKRYAAPTMTIKDVTARVHWLPRIRHAGIRWARKKISHPVLGQTWAIVGEHTFKNV